MKKRKNQQQSKSENDLQNDEVLKLQKLIREIKEKIKYQAMRAEVYKRMIDIAEEQFHISIRDQNPPK